MEQIKSIVLIGAGRVAFHLGKALKDSGIYIVQVYNRSEEKAKELSGLLNCNYTTDILSLSREADLYVFAVSDSAIFKVLESRKWQGMMLVHTSGTLSADIFKPFTDRYGVIYPLQSFTKGRKLDVSKIPFFIEADSESTLKVISNFVNKLSKKVYTLDPARKEALHLAAVFASNFSNHMYFIANEILKKHEIPLSYFEALITETAQKAIDIGPFDAQTGPALRNDAETVKRHSEMLEKEPDWQKIYTFVSENIKKHHKKE
jgi:predicted short-subunit dehydrogenase-like oxidoreductase (DUF2520 family)